MKKEETTDLSAGAPGYVPAGAAPAGASDPAPAGTASAALARHALKTGAFRLTPREPVLWASGYSMPVYTDNRLILRTPRGRELVRAGMLSRLADMDLTTPDTGGQNRYWDAVAGTATAGIAPAVLLAEALNTEFLYVRSGAKEHGLRRRIEGLAPGEESLAGKRVLLVEDLLSTGGSAAAAATALIETGAEVPLCLASFSYGFEVTQETFAELPGDVPCRPIVVFTLDDLLQEAYSLRLLDEEEIEMIRQWRADPFNWGIREKRT